MTVVVVVAIGAVDAVIDLLGMQPCEDSGVVPEEKRTHACNLSGVFLSGMNVFCRAGFMLDEKHGVTLKVWNLLFPLGVLLML